VRVRFWDSGAGITNAAPPPRLRAVCATTFTRTPAIRKTGARKMTQQLADLRVCAQLRSIGPGGKEQKAHD
jgi:hypothetical protein